MSNYIGSSSKTTDVDDSGSDDELWNQLEDEIENDSQMAALREQRMEQLKEEFSKIRDMRESDHGKLTEITDEKEVIKTSAEEKYCVIHFYHRDFQRCLIMNSHMEKIAEKYFSTRFLKVFVENVPWLVEKLSIKVLPCVICFVDGVTKDRLVGFEELGNSDSFDTATLELRLQMAGVVEKPSQAKVVPYSSTSVASRIRGRESDNEYDSDD